MKDRIDSKREMYELLMRGKFGNYLSTWTEEEFLKLVSDGYSEPTSLRCCGDTPGLPYYHRKPCEEILRLGSRVKAEHNCSVIFYESSPDHRIIAQGEYTEREGTPFLLYSRAKTQMRAALREAKTIYGLRARLFLRSCLNEPSYDDFMELSHSYPESVIEFTAYECFVGQRTGRNYVIWEVRNY